MQPMMTGGNIPAGPTVGGKSVRAFGAVVALAVGSALFAALTYYAQPIALQVASPAEENLVYLLAFGGSGAIGAVVVVLAAGRWWGIPLGGLLCPMAGALIHEALVVIPRSGFSWEGALAGMFLNVLQYGLTALIGASLTWAAIASTAAHLRRRRETS